eukprot:CAMPEP_0194701744 /NCGR_PEP_ID=MMETSP0295-20121207/26411_1 /TAXON_ID=39354 /ORGANISM="Heterosigma akashiwo, Strain CCMP2393" /LENGTH=126 /DNA_ID=CAMNT_0039596079 /DNA_START=132 /DNA_END=514 /DNA_ORIENTATION=-
MTAVARRSGSDGRRGDDDRDDSYENRHVDDRPRRARPRTGSSGSDHDQDDSRRETERLRRAALRSRRRGDGDEEDDDRRRVARGGGGAGEEPQPAVRAEERTGESSSPAFLLFVSSAEVAVAIPGK